MKPVSKTIKLSAGTASIQGGGRGEGEEEEEVKGEEKGEGKGEGKGMERSKVSGY